MYQLGLFVDRSVRASRASMGTFLEKTFDKWWSNIL